MRAIQRDSFEAQKTGRVVFSSLKLITCSILSITTLSAATTQAQNVREAPFGIAWQVKGSWLVEGQGRVISTGDAIQPGSLLHPGEVPGNHSIVILLPDGQRILYECFVFEDCSRNFRVPTLYRKPDPFAVDLLARIHEVLIRGKTVSGSSARQKRPLPLDEALTMLGPDNQAQVAGLGAEMPNGSYTYNLRPLNHAYPPQSHLVLEKTTPSITLALSAPGLYDLTIFDNLNTPRMDLLVAAVDPGHNAAFVKSFAEAKALMEDWNDDYQGWPLHEFQRAYLESLVLDIRPQTAIAPLSATVDANGSSVTAEPGFSPRPGLFEGDTEVTLQCDTPGALMHYTVDGSQPMNNSPVYGAPIMVKGTELTIKAFASAPGKKDSAVVVGIFRIQDGGGR